MSVSKVTKLIVDFNVNWYTKSDHPEKFEDDYKYNLSINDLMNGFATNDAISYYVSEDKMFEIEIPYFLVKSISDIDDSIYKNISLVIDYLKSTNGVFYLGRRLSLTEDGQTKIFDGILVEKNNEKLIKMSFNNSIDVYYKKDIDNTYLVNTIEFKYDYLEEIDIRELIK